MCDHRGPNAICTMIIDIIVPAKPFSGLNSLVLAVLPREACDGQVSERCPVCPQCVQAIHPPELRR